MTPHDAKNPAKSGISPSGPSEEPRVILDAVCTAQRKLRLQAGLNLSSKLAPAIFGMASLTLLALLWMRAPQEASLVVGASAATLVAAAFFVGFVLGPSQLSAAVTLDRALGRQGQLAATFEHYRSGPTQGAYQTLLLKREAPAIAAMEQQVPIHLVAPKSLGTSALVAVGFAALLTISPPPPRQLPPAGTNRASEPPPSQLLSSDEAEYLQQQAQQTAKEATSEEGLGAAQEFLELVEEVSAGSLDRKEALQRAAALKSELEESAPGEGTLGDEWKKRGRQLSKSSITEKLGEALNEQRLEDAAEALRTLAERLRDERKPLSKKELDELRESIQRTRQARQTPIDQQAATQNDNARERLQEKRQRLLEKKQEGSATSSELAELERTERKLERLDRRKKQEQEALSELDRALAKAAEELAELQNGSQKKSSDFLDQAARSMNQEAERRLTDEEKKELLDQIERLKERLRQQQKDKKLQERLREFQQKARGRRGQKGSPQGRPKTIPIPQPGDSQNAGGPTGTEGKKGESGPASQQASGQQPGDAHDPQLTGEQDQRLDAEAKNASAAARDTGEGQTESETIASAAQEGFAAGHYEDLYTEYKTVFEEVMERESIPQGRKRHVERYFELIRPRESQTK